MLLPGDQGYLPPTQTPQTPAVTPGTPTVDYGPPTVVDHSGILGVYGLPPDVAAKVDDIFRQYPNDPNAAAQAAISYIRGTNWYAQAFPGIAQARAIGFIGTDLGSEREYKQIYMQYNQLYQQYYGRAMTWQEAYNLFSTGSDPNFVAKHFAGQAYVGANSADIQYLAGAFTEGGKGKGGTLSSGQLSALGDEQAGIDSPMGQKLQNAINMANAKLQRIFQGVSATPGLQLGGAGLSAPGLQGTKIGQTPDIQA